MKCPKCGWENTDTAFFCNSCGSRLRENTEKKTGLRIAAGIAAAVLMAGSFFAGFYGKRNAKPTVAAEATETTEVTEPTEPQARVVDLQFNKTYRRGEILNAGNLGLIAVYENGESKPVDVPDSCEPQKLTEHGTQAVTVSYGGATKTAEVEVLDFLDQKVQVTCGTSPWEDFGRNEDGELVYWWMEIAVAYRNKGNAVAFSTDSDMVITGENPCDYYPELAYWQDAEAGIANKGEYHTNSLGSDIYLGRLYISLPDDPDFAGEHSIQMHFGDVTKELTFRLYYAGDYETGTGWEIGAIHWI